MANEITQTVSLDLTRTGVSYANWEDKNRSISQVGSRATETVFNVTTGAVAIPLGTIGTIGLLMCQNLYTTTGNMVSLISTTAGVTFAKIDAGEIALIPINGALSAPAALATTATNVRFLILEL